MIPDIYQEVTVEEFILNSFLSLKDDLHEEPLDIIFNGHTYSDIFAKEAYVTGEFFDFGIESFDFTGNIDGFFKGIKADSKIKIKYSSAQIEREKERKKQFKEDKESLVLAIETAFARGVLSDKAYNKINKIISKEKNQ